MHIDHNSAKVVVDLHATLAMYIFLLVCNEFVDFLNYFLN